MTGKLLKISRVVVSLAIFAALTLMLMGIYPVALSRVAILGRWQFIAAAMAFNMGIFCFWLLVTLMFGRIYCSTICPLGTLQDIIAHAAMRLRPRHKRIYRYRPPHNTLRYLILVIAVMLLISGLTAVIAVIDPYSSYATMIAELVCPLYGDPGIKAEYLVPAVATGVTGLAIAIIMAVTVTIMAIVTGRTYCNTICPVGATLSLISRHSVFHIEIDTDKCIQCHRCEHTCKAHCIDLRDHVIDSSRCINCFDCLPVCPNDAISYTARRKQLSIPMMQRLSLDGNAPTMALGTSDKYSRPLQTGVTDDNTLKQKGE
ncbi:MAG: 4Fe-4S binding protein [Pseudoflavonifractor sp.]|nr:4Fe-4S binding protein [Pseudoflavonifractor sp.]